MLLELNIVILHSFCELFFLDFMLDVLNIYVHDYASKSQTGFYSSMIFINNKSYKLWNNCNN